MRYDPDQCDEVTRALAAPDADRHAPALLAHLAACPQCSAWEATRPAEPSAAAWEAVWSRVVAGLDRQPAPVPVRRSFRWRPAAAVLGLSQAAALVIGLTLWSTHRRPPAGLPGSPTVTASPVPGTLPVESIPVEIDDGEVVVIRESGKVTFPPDDRPNPPDVDGFMVMFNEAESLLGMADHAFVRTSPAG